MQMVSIPMLPSKFLHLKCLNIAVTGWSFSPASDLLSLVSFLDASPCLETFDLQISNCLPCRDILLMIS
jgi:hypothetical protein